VIEQRISNAHIVIVSHGPDGAGAFSPEGVLHGPCPTAVTPKPADALNCDRAGAFFDPLLTNQGGAGSAAGAFHDDDIIQAITSIPTNIWEYTISQTGTINTIRRVGIGTDDVSRRLNADGSKVPIDPSNPTAAYDTSIALDVEGTMGATNALTGNLCDNTGSNCFPPKALAGSGYIDCASGQSTVMSGVGGAEAKCGVAFPPVLSKSCPPGQYMTGINAGDVQCQAF
jgi:hypothetical protein